MTKSYLRMSAFGTKWTLEDQHIDQGTILFSEFLLKKRYKTQHCMSILWDSYFDIDIKLFHTINYEY